MDNEKRDEKLVQHDERPEVRAEKITKAEPTLADKISGMANRVARKFR